MNRTKMILKKLIYPPKWMLFSIPPLSFAALVVIFVSGNEESVPAYVVYAMSAYSLVIVCAVMPDSVSRLRSVVQNSKPVQRIAHSEFGGKYLKDRMFRGSVGIYQGMTINFLYVVFRVITGIRYASVWFLSMAAYYLVLGILRAYLVVCYRHRTPEAEQRCYRRTAWLLFLLNIPMGGMIVLMVQTNSGYAYPGYLIYVSALYTFYMMAISAVNLVKYRKLGSPILSAAKVLNFVSAMMSILGLQTAMIAQFSEHDDSYRKMMNTITGGFVYGIVILIAVYMLLHSKNIGKKVEQIE